MFLLGGLPLEGLHRLYSILTSISLCHPYLLSFSSLANNNSDDAPTKPYDATLLFRNVDNICVLLTG